MEKAKYIDSEGYCLNLFVKNRTTPVHQEVTLSGECKLCWKVSSVGRHKEDTPGDSVSRDCASLAVGALRNPETRRKILLKNGQARREGNTVSSTYDLRI